MKKFENLCNMHRARFKKNWEFYCIAGDAWLDGFRTAQAEANRLALANNTSYTAKCIREMFSEEVHVEFKDGSHMIGARLVDKDGPTE